MNRNEKLIDELLVKEELYEAEMLNEYFYYEDDLIDKLNVNLHCVKIG